MGTYRLAEKPTEKNDPTDIGRVILRFCHSSDQARTDKRETIREWQKRPLESFLRRLNRQNGYSAMRTASTR